MAPDSHPASSSRAWDGRAEVSALGACCVPGEAGVSAAFLDGTGFGDDRRPLAGGLDTDSFPVWSGKLCLE